MGGNISSKGNNTKPTTTLYKQITCKQNNYNMQITTGKPNWLWLKSRKNTKNNVTRPHNVLSEPLHALYL